MCLLKHERVILCDQQSVHRSNGYLTSGRSPTGDAENTRETYGPNAWTLFYLNFFFTLDATGSKISDKDLAASQLYYYIVTGISGVLRTDP